MGQKIAVLQIIAGFSVEKPLGGIERFVIELCRHLNQEVIQPHVFGLWDFGTEYNQRWIRLLNEAGVETFEGPLWHAGSPYRSFQRAFTVLDQLVASRHFDIIHSHDQFGDVMAILLKRRSKEVRLVRTIQNQMEWHKRPLRRIFLRGLLYPMFYHAEIGVNHRIIADLNRRAIAKVFNKKAFFIHNAVNAEKFFCKVDAIEIARLKQEAKIPLDHVVVGTIGRFTTQKGYFDLVKAIELVQKENKNVTFVMVGSGELEESLKQMTETLGINDRVIFTGPRTDIDRFIHVFDFFISSSLWEGFPTVLMESMAAGVPVIATDIPGTQELIKHMHSGLLVPPSDPQKLAEAVLFAFAHRDLCSDFADRAQEEVDQYSIKRIAVKQEKLYFDLMNA